MTIDIHFEKGAWFKRIVEAILHGRNIL